MSKIPSLFDEDIYGLIVKRAKQFVQRCGWPSVDEDDVVQELLIYLHNRISEYDPHAGNYKQYLHRLITNRISELLESKKSVHNNFGLPLVPLENQQKEAEGYDEVCESHDLIDPRESDWQKVSDMSMDVGSALRTLHPELLKIAMDLTKYNKQEVAKRSGIHRDTLYKKMALIKKHLQKNGIHEDYF